MRMRDKLGVAAAAVFIIGLHLALIYAAGGLPFVVVALLCMAICAGVDALNSRKNGKGEHGGSKP